MEETKSHYYKSFELSDEFWEAVKDEIPEHKRDENRTYQRKPGAGRKPPDKRKILQGIFYILRTGCQWKALPAEYGKGSNTHRYFQLWEKDGFFQRIWAKGLEMYQEIKGIQWEWLSLDGCMTKAPLAQESVGKNPTDRGKNGDKTQHARRRRRPAAGNCDVGSEHP